MDAKKDAKKTMYMTFFFFVFVSHVENCYFELYAP